MIAFYGLALLNKNNWEIARLLNQGVDTIFISEFVFLSLSFSRSHRASAGVKNANGHDTWQARCVSAKKSQTRTVKSFTAKKLQILFNFIILNLCIPSFNLSNFKENFYMCDIYPHRHMWVIVRVTLTRKVSGSPEVSCFNMSLPLGIVHRLLRTNFDP
jgi:hypothetical protein